MLLRTLGTAAGGAFPQWNCACRNCAGVRNGTLRAKRRSQTQVAISADGQSWILLGASPDLRAQIESDPCLHPHGGTRQSPIAAVVLANADVDHVLGLLLLRELQPLRVYATSSVERILREDNSMFGMLNRVVDQVRWEKFAPGQPTKLLGARGEDLGIVVEAVSLGTHYPQYVREEKRLELNAEEASLGLVIADREGKRTGYFPAVPSIDEALLKKLGELDLLFFDGTFLDDDELIRTQGGGQTARQMGHVALGGEDGTLRLLAGLRKPRKIFVHVNNTNPMLDEESAEYGEVRAAGWEIAEDGCQFEL
jgi:pyrroloquinoline quinone biosynthesis protein B